VRSVKIQGRLNTMTTTIKNGTIVTADLTGRAEVVG
jgi:hypothetical protein